MRRFLNLCGLILGLFGNFCHLILSVVACAGSTWTWFFGVLAVICDHHDLLFRAKGTFLFTSIRNLFCRSNYLRRIRAHIVRICWSTFLLGLRIILDLKIINRFKSIRRLLIIKFLAIDNRLLIQVAPYFHCLIHCFVPIRVFSITFLCLFQNLILYEPLFFTVLFGLIYNWGHFHA